MKNIVKRVVTVIACTALAVGAVGTAAATPAAPGIVGGHPATVAPPGTVSLQFDDLGDNPKYVDWHTCGAALVFPREAVVNAHCVTDPPGEPSPAPIPNRHYHVRAGSLDRTKGGQTANVARIVVHPGWNWAHGAPQQHVDDIAVLQLDHPLTVPTIQVAPRSARPSERVTLYGWGAQEPASNSPALPTRLQQLDTRITAPSRCVGMSMGEVCTNNPNGTDGPCHGDSGGPAIAWIHGVPKLIGTASRSADDAHCGTQPTIYTDAAFFRAFIYSVARTGHA